MRRLRLFLLFLCLPAALSAQNPLLIPDTLSGSEMQLVLREGTVQLRPGAVTATMGANGDILGPTLLLQKGQEVSLRVTNSLQDPTTLHWHGLHVSPMNDGGPHIFIVSGETWNPRFTVLDHASTYWYHPHLHHKTNLHVSRGIAGFIIVRDEEEAALALPRRYGVDDFPLAVQTKDIDADNQIVIESSADSIVMVNATIDPVLDVPAQVVRLRLLNGASERAFNFGFSDDRVFYQIGSDGGLLPAPVALTRLMLVPGERAEILCDFGGQAGQSLELRSYGSGIPSGIYGAAQPGMGPGQTIPGYTANPLNGRDFTVLKLLVGKALPDAVTGIPSALVAPTVLREEDADTTRVFIFSPLQMGPRMIEGPFQINGARYSMNTINEYVPFENTEIWQLNNQTPIAHPFHIHDVQFRILDINGAAPPAHMAGRKDVVMVPAGGGVRFITRFDTFHDEMYPYMYHCHMLTHEDNGMMGQFLVMPPGMTGTGAAPAAAGLDLGPNYPNPFSGMTTLRYAIAERGSVLLQVVDPLGRVVSTLRSGESDAGTFTTRFDAADLPTGIYTAVLTTTDGRRLSRPMLHLRSPR